MNQYISGMIKRLTRVPMLMEPIMAIDNGLCISEPMSDVNSSGTIAKMVVSDVIIIALSLRLPAVCIASSSGMPPFRSSFIVSSFKIESLTTIPHVTIIPIADIRFRV